MFKSFRVIKLRTHCIHEVFSYLLKKDVGLTDSCIHLRFVILSREVVDNDEKYEAYRDKYIHNEQHVQIKNFRFFEELHEEFNKIYNIDLSRIEEEKNILKIKSKEL